MTTRDAFLASIRATVWLRPYLTNRGFLESFYESSAGGIQKISLETYLGLGLLLLGSRLGKSVKTSLLLLLRLRTVPADDEETS